MRLKSRSDFRRLPSVRWRGQSCGSGSEAFDPFAQASRRSRFQRTWLSLALFSHWPEPPGSAQVGGFLLFPVQPMPDWQLPDGNGIRITERAADQGIKAFAEMA